VEAKQYILPPFTTSSSGEITTHGVSFALVFGSVERLSDQFLITSLLDRFEDIPVVFVSTAGEIAGAEVLSDSVVVNTIGFEHTQVLPFSESLANPEDSSHAGQRLAAQIPTEGLRHILVFSDGVGVNGDYFLEGLRNGLPHDVIVSGGLAGDNGRFTETLVGLKEPPQPGRIAALAFYGDRLHVHQGIGGGWHPFGPLRQVTRSAENILYELDGTPALDLYKSYLGRMADELPSSALRFPLLVKLPGGQEVVRTILSIDNAARSMTFAGNLPEGSAVQFMMGATSRLVEGAALAAEGASTGNYPFVLLVSCVGRRIVLGNQVNLEVDAVRSQFGERSVFGGYYSNGEIATETGQACALHNQTMTIVAYSET
jgi:hypothetical protein